MWAHGSRVRNLFTQNLGCTLLILPEAARSKLDLGGARVPVAGNIPLPRLRFRSYRTHLLPK